ncbi:MAG: hypothetical protein E6Q40_09775 [Cupriavidus sp.]|nr:MAG: hypothetical protein E6Q40_09775 [Cupriavidus sp.]
MSGVIIALQSLKKMSRVRLPHPARCHPIAFDDWRFNLKHSCKIGQPAGSSAKQELPDNQALIFPASTSAS